MTGDHGRQTRGLLRHLNAYNPISKKSLFWCTFSTLSRQRTSVLLIDRQNHHMYTMLITNPSLITCPMYHYCRRLRLHVNTTSKLGCISLDGQKIRTTPQFQLHVDFLQDKGPTHSTMLPAKPWFPCNLTHGLVDPLG